MRRILTTLAIVMLLAAQAHAQLAFLTRSTPEEEGLSSKDVLCYLDTMMLQKDTDMHGLMVLRNGKVVAEKYNEPFAAQYSHTLYSCSKTFTAIGVGLAIEDSLLTLDTKLVDILPDMLPEEVCEEMKEINVEHLLTMQSGLPVNTEMRTVQTEWIKAYLAQVMVANPGTRFAYDSIDSYLLSAIVQRVTGKTLFQLLRERIFNPLGINEVAWEESPEGITCGGWGLYLQVESMAKFGQLLLQRGMWNGMQLINEEWIQQMCTVHAGTSTQKYGYHIWVMDYPGVVRCDGAYGQYIYIIPDKQMVVAMTQCMRGTAKVASQATWNLSRKASNTALPLSNDYIKLKNKTYQLETTKGAPSSNRHVLPTKVQLGTNPMNWNEIEFKFTIAKTQNTPTLKAVVTTKQGLKFDLTFGYKKWQHNEIKGYPLNLRAFKNNFSHIKPPFYADVCYGWSTPDDLTLAIQYVNWISGAQLQFHFEGNTVKLYVIQNNTTKRLAVKATIVK